MKLKLFSKDELKGSSFFVSKRKDVFGKGVQKGADFFQETYFAKKLGSPKFFDAQSWGMG